MEISFFLERLKLCFSSELPGETAHREMAGSNRRFGYKDLNSVKKSAVLLLIYPKLGQLYFPLIQRQEYDGVHSGQISFPGGRFDEDTDKDLFETATRELNEEIGFSVKTNNFELLGNLSDIYIPPSNFLVKPFVGITQFLPNFILNEREVAEIVEIPLIHFIKEVQKEKTIVKVHQSQEIEVPCFCLKGKKVWGATAMILNEIKELIVNDKVLSDCL